ncbi:MAG: hemolysin III family protein [Opitutaceae bacterium]
MQGTKSYSVGEEIANSVTHGLGVVFAIAALVVLVVGAVRSGDPWRVVSFSFYGASLISLYLASTLYHAVPGARAKQWLKRCDHAAIFALIAGTYTPIMLVTLRGPTGWTMAGIIWSVMVAGIAMKFLFIDRFQRLLLVVYVAMGWAAIFVLHALWQRLPGAALGWLVAGGATYTLGVAFYVWKRLRYGHAIWHLFVLGGSVCHFVFFYRHVLPQ